MLLLRFLRNLQAKLLLNLLFFLFLQYLLLFVVVVIAIKIRVSFFIFAKFADLLVRAFFTFFVISRNFCLRCYSCDIYQVFFCCNEISCYFCDFCRFLQISASKFLYNTFLLKLLPPSIHVEFVILAIYAISSVHF